MLKNKKKLDKPTKVLIAIFVVIVLLIGLLFSYAYYSLDIGGSLSNSNITGTLECLDISYAESNSINLTNAHPVTDDYALTKMTPVTVTITNNCSRNQGDISYTLALSTIYKKALNYNDKYIPDTKIRTHVKKTVGSTPETIAQNTKFLREIAKIGTRSNNYKYITNSFTKDSNYTNYNIKDMYRLDTGVIKNNEVITYKVYMWIDYYEGDPARVGGEYNNSTKGKKFEGAVSLVANAEEYVEPTFARDLIASGELWQSGLEGDGYRCTGSGNATSSTSPDNFICFGTTSLEECKANEEKYMYRIIGVFPDESGEQYLKLIKYKQLGSYKWHSGLKVDVSWEESDLYKGLNGISGGSYSNLFIGNTTYNYLQNNTWLNKIADWKWTATNTLTWSDRGPNYYNITTDQIYLHEINRSTKTSDIGEWTYPEAKIGLMYASDYQMSLGSSSLTMTGSKNSATLKTGWLNPSNNDTTSSTWEWLLSRSGGDGSYFRACRVFDDGNVSDDYVIGTYGVRPVFYLDSTITTSGGIGTYDFPYLIKK